VEIQESDWPTPKSPRDFRPWESFDFLPDGCFLYHQAARQIADALDWTDYKLEALLVDMAEAINAKALPTVSRKTGLRVPKDREPEFLGVVTVDDVNAWLEARGAPYRWNPAPSTTAASVQSENTGPLPLTTSEIALCFAGLKWKTEEEWKKPLGDKPLWLKHCVHTPGQQGKSQTRWNPVDIGAALVRNGHAKANSVRAKFQTQPLLSPWGDAWKTYEAEYLSLE